MKGFPITFSYAFAIKLKWSGTAVPGIETFQGQGLAQTQGQGKNT
jgi:hypothetical protein